MSTLETILSRAMSDPEFADLLFAEPDKALAGYSLSMKDIETFKNMSRTEFKALGAEERLSMAVAKHLGNLKYNSFDLQ